MHVLLCLLLMLCLLLLLLSCQDEVLLEFQVDDTVTNDREDTLLEVAFHVPPSNPDWGKRGGGEGGEDDAPPVPAAKVRS